ncbi:hypothetical protein [Hydrocarboniphaga sp.]|uniref:hypothetical protein n=1 Tax=Hydrocarboniphaga sp. TaxID=2033016 RepID=UPI0026233CC4|nr:hypothetical protein [Hydrocarboniphaga sp.]
MNLHLAGQRASEVFCFVRAIGQWRLQLGSLLPAALNTVLLQVLKSQQRDQKKCSSVGLHELITA